MPSLRLGPGAIRKTISGGGENFGIPRAWGQVAYGSGWPIQPVSPPRDTELPRQIDYPISVNSTLTPRTGWGLMSFASLKEVYENVAEVRAPVNLLWREMNTFIPRLVGDQDDEVPDHPYAWMTQSPDRYSQFSTWLTRFLKSTKMYDAAAVYLEREGNHTTALHYVDGSTLFLIIDESGKQPRPESMGEYLSRKKTEEITGISIPSLPSLADKIPGTPTSALEFARILKQRMERGEPIPAKVPAFTQIIKGTPYAWWSADQIWYSPQSPRVDSPYGESFIEQAWFWTMLIVNILSFELGHYRTGTMPEGFVTLPAGLFPTLDKIGQFEQLFDLRMSANSPVERSRLRFFPDGSKFTGTKKPDFPDKLYAQAFKNILHAFGLPPSEFGDIPGAGLGGKGFKEGAVTDLDRMTLNPTRMFISSLFNDILKRDGVDDVRFDLSYPNEEIDPEKMRTTLYDGMAHGTLTLNDAMAELGYPPVEGSVDKDTGDPDPSHIANKHMIVAGSVVYVIEDMKVGETGIALPSVVAPGGAAGGAPVGPETAVQQDGGEHTPEDRKTLEAAIQNIREKGTLTDKTTSIPKDVTPKNMSEAQLSLRRDNDDLAARQAENADVDPGSLPDEMGLRRVDDRLDKHCGVCCEPGDCDDDYFGAPVSGDIDFAFPSSAHVNIVNVIAMVPDGLPAKPALFKPHGGEDESLQERVGGPLYVREEAAYILDRSLRFFLVPVAYVAEADGELGAAIYYTFGMGEGYGDVRRYAPEWIEKAAVLDYIISQQDRGYKHNHGVHPDDVTRPILIDNGLSFPTNPDLYCESPFCEAMVEQALSIESLTAISKCLNDVATWTDIANLVGPSATAKALGCAKRLLDERAITRAEPESPTDVS